MSASSTPIVYIVEAAVDVTGCFKCAQNLAALTRDELRIVLVLPKQSRIPQEELKDFWRVEYMQFPQLSKQFGKLAAYFPNLVTMGWKLKKMLTADNAACLQLNDFYLLHGWLLRRLGYQGRIVSWVRGEPSNFVGKRLSPLFLHLVYNSADALVVVSEFIRRCLPPSYKTRLIYDSYLPKRSVNRSAPTVSPDSAKKFIYVGNYIAGKGQDTAIKAFELAHKEADTAIELHFYGGDMGLTKNRAYRQALEDQAAQAGLQHNIHFHDFSHDTEALLDQAYAALNFSHSESFSMTVLEASARGVPVVATRCGGPEEIIEDGKTGFLIPIKNHQQAADSIVKLAANVENAQQMRLAAIERVQQKFSPAQFKEQTLDVLGISADRHL